MEIIEFICSALRDICDPELIILHGQKLHIDTGEIREVSLCAVVDTPDPAALQADLYLKIESTIPFSVLIYTPHDWAEALDDEMSFAQHIRRKGTVLYERAPV